MERPSSSSGVPPSSGKSKGRLPSARELIAHYESQGMETQEASVKVIEDLQNALFRVVTSATSKKEVGGGGRKLDLIHSRLVKVDVKLDSKPGYVGTFAIGVASASLLRGIETLLPHVANIWNAVRTSTTTSPSS